MTTILRIPLRAMRTRITLLLPTDVPDGMGGVQRAWELGPQRWAYVVLQPISNRSRANAPTSGDGRLRLVLRRLPGALDRTLRLRWRGHDYVILQQHDVPEQDIQQLICERL